MVDQQVLDETRRQLESSQALLEASQVAVRTRDAQRLAAEATQERTKADIGAAEARVPVAIADERRLAALVDYLTITAPYDGVVLARNVNLGDFVTPASGDPSQGAFSLGVSPSQATPLYLLNRIDPVLFVVGVPEADAAYVAPGSRARVRVPALANHEFPAQVTRTSWALNPTSRTLMAQVELPNPKGKFLPGMYAYGSVLIERPNVRACRCRPSPRSATRPIATWCWTARRCGRRCRPASATAPGWRWRGSSSGRPGRRKGPGRRSTAARRSLPATCRSWRGAPVEVAPAQVETKVGNESPPPVGGAANPHSAVLSGQP